MKKSLLYKMHHHVHDFFTKSKNFTQPVLARTTISKIMNNVDAGSAFKSRSMDGMFLQSVEV